MAYFSLKLQSKEDPDIEDLRLKLQSEGDITQELRPVTGPNQDIRNPLIVLQLPEDKMKIIKYLKMWGFQYDPWTANDNVWSSIAYRYITLSMDSKMWLSSNAKPNSIHKIHIFNCRAGLEIAK